jgi:AraC-like DNA-binding protein
MERGRFSGDGSATAPARGGAADVDVLLGELGAILAQAEHMLQDIVRQGRSSLVGDSGAAQENRAILSARTRFVQERSRELRQRYETSSRRVADLRARTTATREQARRVSEQSRTARDRRRTPRADPTGTDGTATGPRPPRPDPRPVPLRPADAAHLRDTATFVRGLLDHDLSTASPLIIGNATRLLATAVLALLPDGAPTGPTTADGGDDARPDTLGRAMVFVDENAHREISLADIAAAAFVTPRAVQLAFRRHLGTTPTAHLRQVRLDRAHHDLLAADASGDSVTDVAHRWRFSSPSRFAADYRHAFGVTPSSTLHQGRPARSTPTAKRP